VRVRALARTVVVVVVLASAGRVVRRIHWLLKVLYSAHSVVHDLDIARHSTHFRVRPTNPFSRQSPDPFSTFIPVNILPLARDLCFFHLLLLLLLPTYLLLILRSAPLSLASCINAYEPIIVCGHYNRQSTSIS